jgi:hypothetical protein
MVPVKPLNPARRSLYSLSDVLLYSDVNRQRVPHTFVLELEEQLIIDKFELIKGLLQSGRKTILAKLKDMQLARERAQADYNSGNFASLQLFESVHSRLLQLQGKPFVDVGAHHGLMQNLMIIKDFMDYQSLGVPMEYKFFPVPSL